ncbi:ATP-binding protein [Candidatus Fermentibacteria bacterium]|nr:ATP-binding protein [Candidatus Fermentibacteria bacterium]
MPHAFVERLLRLPERAFFLFGPRGVGKSMWLRASLPDAPYFDLLESSLFLELARAPDRIEAMVGQRPEGTWVVVDEVQKVPALLDEVHRLIETKGWRFALCGSSVRKLRHGGANLLAGRAVTRHLECFTSSELGPAFDLSRSLEWGSLPLVSLNPHHAADILDAYVNTYVKEEIKEEGIVRNLPPFLRFLAVAGILNGQVVNRQNVARDASVPRSTVDVYFSILEDTLLGWSLPAYRPGVKVREGAHGKFYWMDAGIARAAAGLLRDPPDRIWRGFALETLIYHELRVFNHTADKHRAIAFYRTAAGMEVDFLIETRTRTSSHPAHVVCVEVKLADRWDRRWEAPMRALAMTPESLVVDRMFGVYAGTREYVFDGVEVLPVAAFLGRLYDGEVF